MQWVDTQEQNDASFWRAELTGASEITTSRQATGTGGTVKWEVIDFG
jgi:hypothetical protein